MKKYKVIVIPTKDEDSLAADVLIKFLENKEVTINEDSEVGMSYMNAINKLRVYNWPIDYTYTDYCICKYVLRLCEVPAKILRMAKLMLLGRV